MTLRSGKKLFCCQIVCERRWVVSQGKDGSALASYGQGNYGYVYNGQTLQTKPFWMAVPNQQPYAYCPAGQFYTGGGWRCEDPSPTQESTSSTPPRNGVWKAITINKPGKCALCSAVKVCDRAKVDNEQAAASAKCSWNAPTCFDCQTRPGWCMVLGSEPNTITGKCAAPDDTLFDTVPESKCFSGHCKVCSAATSARPRSERNV